MADDLTTALVEATYQDADPAVRKNAVLALGGAAKQQPELIAVIEQALDDPSDSVQRAAIFSLGFSGRREAIAPILRALEVQSALRAAVVSALEAIGDVSVSARLIELLRTSDQPRVRRGAASTPAGFALERRPSMDDLRRYEDDEGVVHVLI